MNELFFLSYITLWGVVIAGIFFITTYISKQKKIKHMTKQNLLSLPRQDLGMDINSTFPNKTITTTVGENVQLNKLANKGLIILFTSTTCEACKYIYPILDRLINKFSNEKIVLFMYGSENDVHNTVETFNIKIPVLTITREDMIEMNTLSVPFGYYVSSDMKILSKGIVSSEDLLNLLVDTVRSKIA